MKNSADLDQLASEANCSGSTLFAKTGHVMLAREGLRPRGIKTTPLLRPAFVSPNCFLSYYGIS